MPCVPYAGPNVGFAFLPEMGSGVWIEFEGGDVSYPIWVGGYWREGEFPADAAAAREGDRHHGPAQAQVRRRPGLDHALGPERQHGDPGQVGHHARQRRQPRSWSAARACRSTTARWRCSHDLRPAGLRVPVPDRPGVPADRAGRLRRRTSTRWSASCCSPPPASGSDLPQFGCGLRSLVFAPDTDALAATVKLRVIQGLSQWLAGVVTVVDVVVAGTPDGAALEPGTLEVTVTYTLVETADGPGRDGERRMTTPPPARDRRQLLLAPGAPFNGIDYVDVAAEPDHAARPLPERGACPGPPVRPAGDDHRRRGGHEHRGQPDRRDDRLER